MSTNDPNRVLLVSFDDRGVEISRTDDPSPELTEWFGFKKPKTAKKLRGAIAGDVIEIEVDYQSWDHGGYTVADVERYTGTDRERLDKQEAAIRRLAEQLGIDVDTLDLGTVR